MFLLNHVNNVDPFIVSKVSRSGISGVGKKELQRSPLAAFLSWAMEPR